MVKSLQWINASPPPGTSRETAALIRPTWTWASTKIPRSYGGAILESGIIELPATEVSSSPWSCNRNRKAVRKSTSPTEITLASVSARAVVVAREFLGIMNSVVRLSVGLSADARSRGLQAGSRSVDFRGRCRRFCLSWRGKRQMWLAPISRMEKQGR